MWQAAHSVFELLREEAQLVPSSRILLGGASLGGALAIHAGYIWRVVLPFFFSRSSLVVWACVVS